MSEFTTARDTTAMYLTPVGAYVSVTRNADGHRWHRANCEACGSLFISGSPKAEAANQVAQDHAQTCLRLPERLWPEGGAR
jgi:hypothetical protein